MEDIRTPALPPKNQATVIRVYAPDPDAQVKALLAVLRAAERAKAAAIHTAAAGQV